MKGKSTQCILREKNEAIKNIRVMLEGRKDKREVELYSWGSILNGIIPHRLILRQVLQGLFRCGEVFLRRVYQIPGHLFSYYWLPEQSGKLVFITALFPQGWVRKIVEQDAGQFSAYALSVYGSIPISRAKAIIKALNGELNNFSIPPAVKFYRAQSGRGKSQLIISPEGESCLKGITIEKAGQIICRNNITLSESLKSMEDVSTIIYYSRSNFGKGYNHFPPVTHLQIDFTASSALGVKK